MLFSFALELWNLYPQKQTLAINSCTTAGLLLSAQIDFLQVVSLDSRSNAEVGPKNTEPAVASILHLHFTVSCLEYCNVFNSV